MTNVGLYDWNSAEGSVFLVAGSGNYEMRWLQIHNSSWKEPSTIEMPSVISIPDNDYWVVLVKEM